MAKITGRKTAVKSPHSKKQQLILKALETAARRLGLKVSTGQLRFSGLKLRGGCCLLRGRQWLIMDRNQPFEDLVEIYRQGLPLHEVEQCGLEPEIMELLRPQLAGSAAEANNAEQAA